MTTENKSISLYSMTTAMLELLEAEEVSDEMMQAAFGEIVKKADSCCHFLKNVESEIKAFKEEEKRISERRKAMEATVKRVKEYVQLCMSRMECDKLKAGTFSLAIQDNPAALVETDKDKTPAKFRILIPATWEADTAAIKEALKRGEEVPGWELTKGRSLRIR